MKAAQITGYGRQVEVRDVQMPELSEGSVFAKVYSAAVNPVDWKIRAGYLKGMAALKFPATLGGDFSGVIENPGNSGFKKGDEVYGSAIAIGGGSGAFAEFACAKVQSISLKPKTADHDHAAVLPLVGVSAIQALMEHIRLSKGQKILIHGGAGGIGSIAIQIAKNLGAYVATTVAADDLEFAKSLVPDEVIDYKKQAFENILAGYDAVFDTVGGETYKKSFKVLRRDGIIVSMLEQPNQEMMSEYDVRAIGQFTKVTSENLRKLSELVDKNAVKAIIDRSFPLENAEEAMQYQQKGHPRGKVIIKVHQARD